MQNENMHAYFTAFTRDIECRIWGYIRMQFVAEGVLNTKFILDISLISCDTARHLFYIPATPLAETGWTGTDTDNMSEVYFEA